MKTKRTISVVLFVIIFATMISCGDGDKPNPAWEQSTEKAYAQTVDVRTDEVLETFDDLMELLPDSSRTKLSKCLGYYKNQFEEEFKDVMPQGMSEGSKTTLKVVELVIRGTAKKFKKSIWTLSETCYKLNRQYENQDSTSVLSPADDWKSEVILANLIEDNSRYAFFRSMKFIINNGINCLDPDDFWSDKGTDLTPKVRFLRERVQDLMYVKLPDEMYNTLLTIETPAQY
ncbi:MAG: hypothetical protein ABIJ92_00530 [Candidatus Aenigmatarchaeota archaeon]